MSLSLCKTITLILLCVSALACENKPATSPTPEAPTPAAPVAATPSPDNGAGSKVVVVDAQGSKFDPPVEISQLPDGVWYCDMGTSHYARKEQGDGKCELCKMALKHKLASSADTHEH